MVERSLNAREVLKDVQAGMDHSAMLEKYKLSPAGLRKVLENLVEAGLLQKVNRNYVLPHAHRISTRKIVQDVGARMSPQDLIDKYLLSPRGLRKVLTKLIEVKAIERADLGEELEAYLIRVEHVEARELERYYLDFDLPIFAGGSNQIQGRVRDITEKGIGTIGIPADIDEMKKLEIRHQKYVLIKPFMFQAKCRWIKQEGAEGQYLAGFQIIDISDEAVKELQYLLRLVTFQG